jgi:hypothetical protein
MKILFDGNHHYSLHNNGVTRMGDTNILYNRASKHERHPFQMGTRVDIHPGGTIIAYILYNSQELISTDLRIFALVCCHA